MNKIILLFFIFISPLIAHSPFESAIHLQKNEQFSDAIALYETLLTKEPTHASALFNIGQCYLALGLFDKAIAAYEKIVHLYPDVTPAVYNCAYTKKTAGRLNEAIEMYKKIIALDPNYDTAHLALGFAYLTQGDFDNGWKQHSRYLQKSGKNGDRLRSLLDYGALQDKIIVLRPEGGLGDTLQFIRYAQRLHDMGAHVIACVQQPLMPLFSTCPYIDQLISPKDSMPVCHADATYMSLPAIFSDNENTFPTTIPYIFADQNLMEQWKQTVADDHNLKIGICWQADVHNDISRLPIARRGCPLTHFLPLSTLPNISFYSVQKYDGVEELNTIPDTFIIHHYDDLDEKEGPFMSTAALMKNMDLIITVDTAIAHLAGGLGCTVWLLLPYSTDWRWIYGRTDSPWYPTMRIFKQKTPFDWQGVIEEVYQELVCITSLKKAGRFLHLPSFL